MPTRYPTKTGVQWRAVVKMEGRVVATKLFPPGAEGKREAAQWERDARKAFLEEKNSPATPMALPSVLEWANRYMAYAEKQFTKQTFMEKKTVFRLFLIFTKAAKLETITADVVMRYLQKQNTARSGFAANKDRKNLAAAWEWGRKYLDGFPVVANPFLGIPKFREVRKPRYVPGEEDFWKVVKATQGQDKGLIRLKDTFDKKYGHGFQSRSDNRSSIRRNHHVHEFCLSCHGAVGLRVCASEV